MPATRKSFSRGANTKSSRPSTLSLSSFTSKSDPTAAHKASLAARKASKGKGGGKKHEGTKERDRQMMEDLNRGGDVGYKGRELFLAGLTKRAPEAKAADPTATSGTGTGMMNEERRQLMGREAELVSSLGGMKTK